MSAYVVFTRTKTIDQKELEKYRTGIKATMKDHSIEVLVADGKHELLEGDPIEGMVIVKFPSVKAAKDWCYSEAYQNVSKHRKDGEARNVLPRLFRQNGYEVCVDKAGQGCRGRDNECPYAGWGNPSRRLRE